MNTEYTKMAAERPHKPDAALRRSDPEYLRELLSASNLSQRAAARLLDVDDRTMRNYASGKSAMPYSVQFCLEVLAGMAHFGQVSDAPKASIWHTERARRITRADAGKILLGRGAAGYVVGIVRADEWGVVIEPLPGRSGVDGTSVPAGSVTEYVLIDTP